MAALFMAILQKQLLSTSRYLLMYYIIEAAEVHFFIKVIKRQKCFLQIFATFFLVTIVDILIPTDSLPMLVLHFQK